MGLIPGEGGQSNGFNPLNLSRLTEWVGPLLYMVVLPLDLKRGGLVKRTFLLF